VRVVLRHTLAFADAPACLTQSERPLVRLWPRLHVVEGQSRRVRAPDHLQEPVLARLHGTRLQALGAQTRAEVEPLQVRLEADIVLIGHHKSQWHAVRGKITA
jgi:hypothetical protein